MKIAFTADLHLTSRAQHPERFQTLENLLAEMGERGLTTLVVGGDLFDASRQNYADFERLCSSSDYQHLQILVIPGNHDPAIDNRQIVAGNVDIIAEPSIRELGGRPFLFLPYEDGRTMGEVIAGMSDDLAEGQWVLVGHGDWAGGLRVPNPTEPGVYMPLTRRDVERYLPARVLLGHIHGPMDAPPVHYVGSPCGLDITETGKRRYLLYDTGTGEVESRTLATPLLYFDESFVIVPVGDEAGYLREQIAARRREWALTPEEKAKARVRVKVAGYSADRAALRAVLQEAFAGIPFYQGREPDIDEVSISDDVDRHYIAEQVRARLGEMARPDGVDDPGPDEILLQALHIVYGR